MVVCLRVNTGIDIETGAIRDLSADGNMSLDQHILRLQLPGCHLCMRILQVNTGVDIETGAPKDLSADGIMDLYATKWWAVKLATDAVITVLKVDQIIMAKQVSPSLARALALFQVLQALTL